MTKLIVGSGYLGSRVAALWRDAGQQVTVTTRSEERARTLRRQGFDTRVVNVIEPDTLRDLPRAETILYSVGYDRSTAATIEETYAGGVRNVLARLRSPPARFIYISTTGVYGSAGGGWVDEDTPTDPQRAGGRASLGAEQALAAHRAGARGVILRLAGIYGPGRVPFISELRDGQAIPAPEKGHLNLIHVDDAARVVLAAAEVPFYEDGPRIYCVSDGAPVVRGDFYRAVARQIGAPAPRFVAPDPSSARAARAAVDRRVTSARMLAELCGELRYPNYRLGLAAILGEKR